MGVHTVVTETWVAGADTQKKEKRVCTTLQKGKKN